MPLAILLQEQLGILTRGVDEKLRHWDEATERFALVVDRLRSAYLVHWFGTALPSVGVALRVGLANMHELRARWLAIGARRRRRNAARRPEPDRAAARRRRHPRRHLRLTAERHPADDRRRLARAHVVGEGARRRQLAHRRAAGRPPRSPRAGRRSRSG